MHTGQCHCGAVKIQLTGDPVAVGQCFCCDCRRTSGSTNALNWFIPSSQLRLEGTPHSYAMTGGSGKPVINYFCSNCGVTLYRAGEVMPGTLFVKAGILNDVEAVNRISPQGEIFVRTRPDWVTAVQGASQKQEML